MKSTRRKRNYQKKSFVHRLEYLLKAALIFCILSLGKQLFSPTAVPGELQPAVLEKVVDGDTIYAFTDGESIKIRLIGINTPESVSADADKNTPEGTLASDYLKNLLPLGSVIYLEYDEGRYDPYNRVLAYVWLNADADTTDFDEFCQYNLNAIILQNTYCETMKIQPNVKYAEWFEKIENRSAIFH